MIPPDGIDERMTTTRAQSDASIGEPIPAMRAAVRSDVSVGVSTLAAEAFPQTVTTVFPCVCLCPT